jgi:hypothetical protein
LQQQKYPEAIAEFNKIKDKLPLDNLPFCKNTYSKNVLSNKDGFWLSLLHWDSDYKSTIHGHPDLAFYYIVDGKMINTTFDNHPLKMNNSQTINAGDFFYSIGEKGALDNGIHELQTMKKSISLHFYSSDPSYGIVFDEEQLLD